MNTPRLFGIETEYGITREDIQDIDPVVESMELVRAHLSGKFEQAWDYKGEDPHEDQRGFRVTGLQQDREEEAFSKLDAKRPLSFYELKSDLVLENGARFYNDHTHPEYSTPECRSLQDLVAHDRAGERIVQHATNRRNRALGTSAVQVYKNNTDLHGHSYGCHDNYLIPRALPFEQIAKGLLPFLVSRQLFAGSGKVGIEAQDSPCQHGRFQISQRADFMETEMSVDTMHNRPILNTRDEPHANRVKYRRLHLIVGDANMCEYATALKVGTTRVIFDLIGLGAAPDLELHHPVSAIKTLSQDPDLKAVVSLKTGGTLSGIDIQAEYLLAAQKHLSGHDEETDWVLSQWEKTLDLLQRDRRALVGRLDWVTKYWLLESFVQEECLEWSDPWLASLDLEYHNLNPDRGLYLGLEAEGRVERLCTEPAIEAAMTSGPRDTRGGIRGLCVKHFRDQIKSVQWEHIQFKGWLKPRFLDMNDMFEPNHIHQLWQNIEEGRTLSQILGLSQDTLQKKEPGL